ncbi:hypothetical protein LINPERHAP1_LOCUS5772 [Linum perenne]
MDYYGYYNVLDDEIPEDPTYEGFIQQCMLQDVVWVAGVTPCRELVTTLLKRWQPERSMFHVACGEAPITLEDVHVLTRLPTT